MDCDECGDDALNEDGEHRQQPTYLQESRSCA